MFKAVKVNNLKIKPIVDTLNKKKKWRGSDIFKREYFSIALLSKTASGKTTVIANLIEKFASKNTVVIVFSSTIGQDDTWKAILNRLDEREIGHISDTHFKQGGENQITEILNTIEEDDKEEPEEEEEKPELQPEYMRDNFTPEEEIERKKKKIKFNYLWIFDDLSSDMRDKEVCRLVKKNRHYRSRVIISSQSLTDIKPECHAQLYALCLFTGITDTQLEKIYEKYQMFLPVEEFIAVYKKVTAERYQFLTLIPTEQELRINLNRKIERAHQRR